MNVDSVSIGTPLNSSSVPTSIGKSSFSNEPVSETLKAVDEQRSGDRVSISSASLFLFELNTYAESLSDDERNQFADTLEASGDSTFSQGFLNSVRYSMSYGGVTVGEKVIGNEPASDNNFGVVATYAGSIPYAGLAVNHLDDYAASGQSQFNNTLNQILTDSSDDLTPQDSASIRGTFEFAINSSFTSLQSDFDIFSVNYQFLIAQDVIDGFDLSNETSSALSGLLNSLKENNLQVNSSNLSQALQDAEKYPGHAGKILANAEKISEGIELNNLVQGYLGEPNSNLFDVEESFTELMKGSKSVKSSGIADYADLFDYYRTQESQFKRTFIEQDWSVEEVQSDQELIEGELGEPEDVVSSFALKYIDAVNTYLSTMKAE